MELLSEESKKAARREIDELKRRTSQFKQSITDQLSNLTSDVNKMTRVGLVVAGVAVGTFIVYKLLSSRRSDEVEASLDGEIAFGDHSKKVAVHYRRELPIVTMIKNAIASFILGIARDKIMAFIEEVNNKYNDKIAGKVAEAKG